MKAFRLPSASASTMRWSMGSRPMKDHQEGDLVKIDAGLIYKGYHSDAARTYAVGEVSADARLLMDVTKQCFFEGSEIWPEPEIICMIFPRRSEPCRKIPLRDRAGSGRTRHRDASSRRSGNPEFPAKEKRASSEARYDPGRGTDDQSGQSGCSLDGRRVDRGDDGRISFRPL